MIYFMWMVFFYCHRCKDCQEYFKVVIKNYEMKANPLNRNAIDFHIN